MRYSILLTAILATDALSLRALAQDAAPAAPTTQPTSITLKVDAADGMEAIRQLTEQIGSPVQLNRSAKRPIKFEAADKPFVIALTEFYKATGLSSGNYDQLSINDVPLLTAVPINDSLSLLVNRTNVSANMPVTQRGSLNNYNYSVQMTLLCDPALRIVSVSQGVNADVIDYDGSPYNRNESYYSQRFGDGGSGGSRFTWPVSVNLNSTKAATRINRLAGRIRAWQVADEASVDIDIADIANPKPIEGNQLTASVTVEENNRRGNSNMLAITLTGPAAEAFFDSRWEGVVRGCVSAVDVDQKLMRFQVNNVERAAESKSIKLKAYYQQMGPRRAGEDLLDKLETLRIRLPLKIRSIDIPFELKDLPLP